MNSSNPRARKAVQQIYCEQLDQYMQWFPWSWFSHMQFIGAGGFSAVYAAFMSPPYDIEPVKVSLKVVDDKILNEVYFVMCVCVCVCVFCLVFTIANVVHTHC
jgi:hypothetical protein